MATKVCRVAEGWQCDSNGVTTCHPNASDPLQREQIGAAANRMQEKEKTSHKLYTKKKKKRKLQRSEIFLHDIKEKWTITSSLYPLIRHIFKSLHAPFQFRQKNIKMNGNSLSTLSSNFLGFSFLEHLT
jgi:hypothetical protein